MFFCPAHHVRKRGRQLKEHGIRRTAWGGVLGMGFCLSVCVCVSVFGFVWVCVCYCFLQPPQAQFHWFCFGTACLGVTGGGRSFWASGCARKSKGGGTHTHTPYKGYFVLMLAWFPHLTVWYDKNAGIWRSTGGALGGSQSQRLRQGHSNFAKNHQYSH